VTGDRSAIASPAGVTPREPSSLRVLTLTTLQQAGLTSIRFGLPILAPYWRDAFHLSLARVGVLLGAFDLGALLLFIPIGLLTDRWGGAGVLGAGALFTAAMTAVTTRANGYWPLALLLAIAGLGCGSGQTAGTRTSWDGWPWPPSWPGPSRRPRESPNQRREPAECPAPPTASDESASARPTRHCLNGARGGAFSTWRCGPRRPPGLVP